MKHLPRKQHSELLLQANEAVSHIESDKNYSCFFLKNGQKILMAYSLLVYQKALEISFVRINRSLLINRNAIETIVENRLSTVDGQIFMISRRRKKALMAFVFMFFIQISIVIAQNVVDANPQGTDAILDVKGLGSTVHLGIGKAAIRANTGIAVQSDAVVGTLGISGNSNLSNYGLFGSAIGQRTAQSNFGVFGVATGLVSNKSVGVFGEASQKGGDAYGVEGYSFLNDATAVNKKGVGGYFVSTVTSNTPNTIKSYGVEGVSNGTSGGVNIRAGVKGETSGVANQQSHGVWGENYLANGVGSGVNGEVIMNSISSDLGFGGKFSAITFSNVNGSAEALGITGSVFGQGTVSKRVGLNLIVTGNSSLNSYGIFASNTNSNSTALIDYGGYFKVAGTSVSQKYGLFVETEGSGNLYGAYIKEKTGIGVLHPTEKLEVDGRLRLRHNGNNAGIFIENSNNVLDEANSTFVGLQNATQNSEKFGVKINNDWKLLIGNNGLTEVNGSLNVANNLQVGGTLGLGSGTISKFIRIETTMSITYAANNFTTLSVTATGAVPGDNVVLNFTGDIGSLLISQVWVSSSNTVSVKLYNPTATSNSFPNNTPVRIILTR
ncbi:LytTR family transcriptional regulator [Lacihabitans sp. LS3-19]|uniref:LytTR family DNA-binding domain-containing protein n=1 Tax=Lacihabitans sp. LS3-19 TaxID=2487335 RepID=UPI0020CB9B9F|nr:LytTR family DNA-binding domain-containing protein [Lacihabitans sp. LS3-19]MCP9766526.1 LytTR family transcriptional regulator [Lacihabitans sp. LS3-19]